MRALPSIALILTACGGGNPAPEAPATSAADAEAFRDIPYAGWDEDADTDRSGVTICEPGRVGPGLTVYGDEDSSLIAIDATGSEVQRWTAPGFTRVEYGVPLAGGRAALLSTDEGVALVDGDGTLRWQTPLSCHHDLWPRTGGGFLVPVHTERAFQGRRVRFDAIVGLSADGDVLRRWDLFEHRDLFAELHQPSPLDVPPGGESITVFDYYHLNAVQELPEDSLWPGAWLMCLRNVDLVLVLDPERSEVLWSWGPGELEAPHHPTMTDAGTVLIFDNGRRRRWSRVIEVDPASDQIVWTYRQRDFFSDVRSGAQRLAGGTTLITESERGRLFEVTPSGEVVWEYWNPALSRGARRRIYRALRVPEKLVR